MGMERIIRNALKWHISTKTKDRLAKNREQMEASRVKEFQEFEQAFTMAIKQIKSGN